MKKVVSGVVLALFLVGVLTSALKIQPIKAEWTGTIYIQANGSIEPSDAPIITYDNVTYTLFDNITSVDYGIVVQRDNIIIDGAGYTVQGTGWLSKGVYLPGRSNVTIKNTVITTFEYGIQLSYSNNNSITGNNITNNSRYGILLYHSNNNSITGNNITNNNYGIWLDSSNNVFYHNNFVDNTQHVYVYAGSANVWDDGYPSGGNYWSDYGDTDQFSGPYQNETGSDGIWDHPYVMDANNRDNYPMVVPEFPTLITMLLTLLVLTVATTIHKRTKLKKPIH